ncbi:Clp protease ClpP [Limosilactobacillus sp. STM2_1]|uniref:ATP-dependent Clp protease proteolytic subunit n=1 Tax=Limosilactobacillus rudii TaxID=2759755 RepID=A0A7W3YM39_9LACO|nr:head maturation protease, ClpP-related [Limosilactobacillus rudii]MBB1079061.1 Clp protease ClpP [Limosilactobacillus rudii]MBB1097064.1 Clp protease ClpP [Limosilactobacillus rudii]MCD7134031.1 Clp protease ClpP [Limosilactobacillus rudii]
MTLPKYLTVKQETQNNLAELYIDGEIVTDEWEDSDTSAAGFRDTLKSLGDVKTINLHINSPGGSVFEGIAIYNMLKQNLAHINVYIDGLAASIASVIAMSGDVIFMPSNSMLMIHNPWTMAVGNSKELRKQADDLDKITQASVRTYLEKAGDKLNESTLKELMDEETWLTAQEAKDYGLADEVVEANQAAASLNKRFIQRYHNVPEQFIKQVNKNPKAKHKELSQKEELNRIKQNALDNSDAMKAYLKTLKEEIKK